MVISLVFLLWFPLVCYAQEDDVLVRAAPVDVFVMGYLGPFVLVNFNQLDPEDVHHWRIYHSSPFDPDNWVWYKSQQGENGLRYHHWQVTNEHGSPHTYTIHIQSIPLAMIGRINIGVAAVDDMGNISDIAVATWNVDLPGPEIVSGDFVECNK